MFSYIGISNNEKTDKTVFQQSLVDESSLTLNYVFVSSSLVFSPVFTFRYDVMQIMLNLYYSNCIFLHRHYVTIKKKTIINILFLVLNL